jgi:upstream activation factor subunit UAF30
MTTSKPVKNVKPESDVAPKSKKATSAKVDVPKVDTPKVPKAPKVSEPKVTEPKVENVVVEPVDSSVSDSFSQVMVLMSELNATLNNTKLAMKLLEKQVSKEMKVLDKFNQKKNKNKGTRAPSGFVKPTKISDDLAVFLKKEKGSMMARTEVTKEMTAYIREKSLQDKANGRKILPDEALKKLLNLTGTDELTYFNLQKYMSPHFEKSVKA